MEKETTESFCCEHSPEHYPVFKTLNKDEFEKLESHARIITFNKGENLFKQGMPASVVMYIRSGIVKITKEGTQGVVNLNLLNSCNFLALSVLSLKKEFPYSAYALTKVEVVAYDIAFFSQTMMLNAAFASGLFHVMAQNQMMLSERFYSLCSKQMHGRMADILICIAKRIYKKPSFELQLSRQDLGDLTGMAKESAIRILKDMERDGLIRIKAKNIQIIDFEGLSQLSRIG
ncbi:MAG: Crp/Fnr family transcriptional regulator [Bacteroidales bacterium]